MDNEGPENKEDEAEELNKEQSDLERNFRDKEEEL